MAKPRLTKDISIEDFTKFYWLKEDLVDFCRENNLSIAGGKISLAARIESFLKGEQIITVQKQVKPTSDFDWNTASLTLSTIITDNYRNTENVRSFFRKQIGPEFAFNVAFMNWMKANAGKNLKDAVTEWHRIREAKKNLKGKTEIDKQFEYNTYIRDFLTDNPTMSLKDAIKYWKLKRELPEPRKYKKTDLKL